MKPQVMWAVVDPQSGNLFRCSFAYTKDEAIREFLNWDDGYEQWDELEEQGYRARRVRVEVMESEDEG